MFKSIQVTLIAGLILATSSVRADDLFSEFSIESVFGTVSTHESSSSSLAAGKRIAGASALARTLRDAGLEVEELDSRTVQTTVENKGQTSHVVRVSVDVDADRLELTIRLGKVDEAKVLARKLLELLSANRDSDAAFFAYDAQEKHLELRKFVANNGINGTELRERLNQLATVAENTRASWDAAAAPASTSPGRNERAGSSSTPKAQFSLIGTWTGSASNQAFALQFKADGTFVLAVVQGTTQTRSEGKFTLDAAGQLKLQANDGTTLSGKTKVVSSDRFQLTLDGGTSLLFKRSK